MAPVSQGTGIADATTATTAMMKVIPLEILAEMVAVAATEAEAATRG